MFRFAFTIEKFLIAQLNRVEFFFGFSSLKFVSTSIDLRHSLPAYQMDNDLENKEEANIAKSDMRRWACICVGILLCVICLPTFFCFLHLVHRHLITIAGILPVSQYRFLYLLSLLSPPSGYCALFKVSCLPNKPNTFCTRTALMASILSRFISSLLPQTTFFGTHNAWYIQFATKHFLCLFSRTDALASHDIGLYIPATTTTHTHTAEEARDNVKREK